MLSSILFCIVVTGSIVYAKPVSNNLCDASGSNQADSCHLVMYSPFQCNFTKLNLSGTDTAKTCKSVTIFWGSPKILILIIETPFTQQHQSYSIQLQSAFLNSEIVYVYQVSENGTLTTHQPKGDTITFQSNTDYQVILRIEIRTALQLYGINIEYDIIKNKNY